MIRKTFFWLHLVAGVTAGLFIFIMAATGVVLSFERQITEFVDRGIRSVPSPGDTAKMPLNHLLDSLRRADVGDPTAITVRNHPQAATEFSINRGKTIYVDPYSGAVLGVSSVAARQFFFKVEQLHRTLGAPLGSKSVGHWLTGVSNLLFGALLFPGLILWLPRKWSWRSVRAIVGFRTGLSGRAREWNWHNVVGIWCALPLLVIALTGVVMSFEWANALLFRLSGSAPPASGRRGGERPPRRALAQAGDEPNYDQMLAAAMKLNPAWRTITLNIRSDTRAPVSAAVDTGTGGQPQNRIQYFLNRNTGAVIKSNAFSDGNLAQRLRAFVRFGHTGEFGGLAGQTIAAIASLGACLLVYTGLSLAVRRLAATLKRKHTHASSYPKMYAAGR